MLSRRRFLATLLASVSMIEAAAAKGNGNGGGKGKDGGGNGNGAGNGNGNAGGNGKGEGNAGAAGTPAAPATAPAAARPSVPPSLRLRHSNGFEEEIAGGRYEMRDNRGRQIVNRVARNADYVRLRRLMQ